jgi:hypothetical protein
MNISPKLSRVTQQNIPAPTPQPVQTPAREEHSDSFESNRNEKVLGTIGAGVGAITGRLGLLAASSTLGAMAGSAVLGPLGAIVGGAIGLGAGAFVEFRDKAFKGIEIAGRRVPLGRMVGGMVGGVIGSTVGRVLDKIPFKKPKLGSHGLHQESQGFSLKKLVKNVGNVNHTSLPTMDEAGKTQEIVDILKPGDILLTNSDLWMDFEIPLKLVGSRGDWTHTAVYDGHGKSIEALASKGVVERPVEELVGGNHHVRVMRPKYSEGGADKAIEYARSKVGMPYDFKFSDTDDSFYCIELSQKALAHAVPELPLQSNKLFWNKFGPRVVTPETFNKAAAQSENLDIVYDTGSNFNRNYLAKFS